MTDSNSSSTQSEQLLTASVEMLTPLVKLMVAQGVTYPQFAQALKQSFIDAAREQLVVEKQRITDAAVSLRSGVHRKEVRSRSAAETTIPAVAASPRRALSMAEQVFTRWLTDVRYRNTEGKPSALPFTGPAPSFDSLASSITKDFSRRTLLNELVRLGLVREENESAIPISDSVVPRADLTKMTTNYRDQLRDHLAAGAANIQAISAGRNPPFLEQSMYANGLSNASIEQMAHLGRQIWRVAFDQLVGAATQRVALDEANKHQGRMRFGVYCYSEPAADQEST